MSAQLAAAVSQRCHRYVKVKGWVPLQVPLEAVSFWPGLAEPEIVGGYVFGGVAGIVTGAKLVPLKRSPSTQPEIPGTRLQSVHCQNVHPCPPQFCAGTFGAAAVV